jgi:hypothetical protein
MMRGASSFALRKLPRAPTRFPASLAARIGWRVAAGAIAKTFADSPVPWPTGSF